MPKPVNDVVAYKLQRHIVEGLEARKEVAEEGALPGGVTERRGKGASVLGGVFR